MAKAYIRKDSQFIWVTFSVNKKRYRKKTKFEATKSNLKLVQNEVLPVMMHKIKAGEILLEKDKNNNKFEYYSKLFLKTKRSLKENTYKAHYNKTNFWNNIFKNRDITSIKKSEVKKIIFYLNIEVVSMKGYLCTLRGIFNEAIDDEVLERNAADIKLPKTKAKEILPFSKEEVKKLLDNAEGFFKCFLAVAFYTGCRTGELLAMKWQNIDYANKRIWIDATVGSYKENIPKTGKSRYVPIFDFLIPYLKEQEKRTGLGNYVFCTKSKKPYASTNLYQYFWKPLLKRSKIPLRRLYETRHTFATNMLDSKLFSLNQIAAWLGHSSVQTLIQNYNKFIPSEIAKFDSNFDVFDTKKVTEIFRSA